MSNVNVAMVHARRLELHEHPAPPAGLEVHGNGIFHEAQRGDGLQGIARDYSRAYHMDISTSDLRTANATALRDGLQAGELLKVPGLTRRFDTMFLADNTGLSRVGTRLVHTVVSGDTLSNLARKYDAADGMRLTADQLYAANQGTIGANANALQPGQQLVIPGISTASPKATLESAKELAGNTILTRTARVQRGDGSVETIDVMSYTGALAKAERFGSVEEAEWAVRNELQDGVLHGQVAIVQARDGAFLGIPLVGHELSDNLDDSDRVRSLAMRAEERGVVGVAELDRRGDAAVIRRYDQ